MWEGRLGPDLGSPPIQASGILTCAGGSGAEEHWGLTPESNYAYVCVRVFVHVRMLYHGGNGKHCCFGEPLRQQLLNYNSTPRDPCHRMEDRESDNKT